MNLLDVQAGEEYIVKEIQTDDEALNDFLFTLGCYSGEPITVVSHLKGGCVVAIKDARYNIDRQLAEAIIVGSSKFSGVSPSLGWSVVRVSLKFMPSLVGAVSGV